MENLIMAEWQLTAPTIVNHGIAKRKLYKIIRSSYFMVNKLELFGALTLSLVTACTSTQMKEPKPEDYKNTPSIVSIEERLLYIRDLDDNDQADLISFGVTAYFIAPGYEKKAATSRDTRIMTPEMRKVATEAMLADRRLKYLIDKHNYDANGGNKYSSLIDTDERINDP